MKAATFLAAACAVLLQTSSVSATADLDTSPYRVPDSLAAILAANGPGSHYPTDITRNIVPKPLHSHNDYWRDTPFYSALSVGAVSVEADVWLVNGTLYIGHEQAALTPNRTFDGLYIQPILSVLRTTNPVTMFNPGKSRNGVFDMAGAQTLYLWIDVKTDGALSWPYAIRALQPLRDAGYLTTVSANGTITPGPVTVIGTGNTPLNQVQGVAPRDYFWDAPLPTLGSTFSNITASVSPIASTDFAVQFGNIQGGIFNASQMALLNTQISIANGKGIGVRYWDTPAFPISTRNRVWTTLWNAGVSLINVDDLVAGAGLSDFGNFWEIGQAVISG